MSIMNLNNITKKNRLIMPVAIAFLLVPAGCATSGSIRQTLPGDIAGIHFQCMLPGGEIAAATDDNAVKKEQQKANIYLVRQKNDPISVVIPDPAKKPAGEKETSFENDIVARLAGQLTGLKEGETRHVELTAQDIPERKEEDYVVRLARVRENPMEIKMTIDQFKFRTGVSPETEKKFSYDSSFDGQVKKIAGKEVVIRLLPKEGAVVKTPFGESHISESAGSYKIVIDARVGSLVRSAHLIGRITDIDDKTMTIDYRNPFGSATLSCDVTIQSITEAKSDKEKTSGK
ncbi:MAG: hypothetical protein ABSC11_06755 [Smithella sp.]